MTIDCYWLSLSDSEVFHPAVIAWRRMNYPSMWDFLRQLRMNFLEECDCSYRDSNGAHHEV